MRLQNDSENGGLQLTCATLAAFTKYPRGSRVSGQPDSSLRWKKHGFFQDERKWFEEVANETGLLCFCRGEVWARHPLAYLVEAADDICYRIIDAEDGYRTGYISHQDLTGHLEGIVDDTKRIKRAKAMSVDRQIEHLRAVAINKVIQQVAKKFMEAEPDLLAGRFGDNLLGCTDAGKILKDLKQLAREKAYKAGPVVQVEAAGFNVLGELISRFAEASWNQFESENNRRSRTKTLIELMPQQFLEKNGTPHKDPYKRLLAVTDFVSGMTDTFAITFYQCVMGISLPGRPIR